MNDQLLTNLANRFALEHCVASCVNFNILHGAAPLSSITIPEHDKYTWRVQGVFEKRDRGETEGGSDVDIVLVGSLETKKNGASEEEEEIDWINNPPPVQKPMIVLGNFKVRWQNLGVNLPDAVAYINYVETLNLEKFDAFLLLGSLDAMPDEEGKQLQKAWQEKMTELGTAFTVLIQQQQQQQHLHHHHLHPPRIFHLVFPPFARSWKSSPSKKRCSSSRSRKSILVQYVELQMCRVHLFPATVFFHTSQRNERNTCHTHRRT
jgi:hypothetical protein